MKRSLVSATLACMALSGFSLAVSQTPSTGMSQPKVIWIFREDVKPARGDEHTRIEHGFAKIWEKAQVQPFLGLDAVSGNATETMFISGYDSFAAFEKDFHTFSGISSGAMKPEFESLERVESSLVNSVKSSIAVYRPDLSYLGDRFMGELPKARYLQVEMFRVRLGRDADFAAGAKMFQDAHKKANLEEPWTVYQVLSGAPAGTYLIFGQLKSLQDLDSNMANDAKVREAMGEDQMKQLMKGEGDVFVSIESNVYSINPKISYVTKDFAAADPAFWEQTPSMMAKASPNEKKRLKEK